MRERLRQIERNIQGGGELASGSFPDYGLDRRDVLRGAGLLLGSLVLGGKLLRAAPAQPLADELRDSLEKRALVYISPLLASGKESRCHGEVWYFLDGADVVIGTDPKRWKARALQSGRDRARLWVTPADSVTDYRKGRSFDAVASFDSDPGTFERLLSSYGKKYPDEWGKWGPRFAKGRENGSRVLIRYRPLVS